jgi:hypothetical protein
MPKGKLAEMLIAVLACNAIYFAILLVLPESLRHAPFRMDFGLLRDFLICFALYLLLNRKWAR